MARWRRRARRLKTEAHALYLAYRLPGTPRYAKIVALLVVVYALSPIDLIPDFIPILGYVDDLILVPLGVMLAIRLIPAPVMAECRTRADSAAPPDSRLTARIVIITWAILAAVLAVLLFSTLR